MKFNYQVRTKDGEVQIGVIEAASREAALNLLQKHKFYVTFLKEIETKPFFSQKIDLFKKRASRKDVVIFTRQLSILFKSGVPLPESLLALANQAENPEMREVISKIEEEIEGGAALSQALSRYPRLFVPFYVSMIKSGEAVGKLSETLSYLAEHLEREHALNSKIRGAMIYPLFVLVVFFIISVVMVFFVFPNFSLLLSEMGEELPLITKAVMGAANFARTSGWIIFIVLLVLFFFLIRYSRTKEGKALSDRVFLRTPIIKDFLKKIYLSRFAENFATLISGGLPIVRALEITGDIVGNDVYKNIIIQTREGVKRGETMSSVLRRYPEYVPPFFVQMAVVGEKSGRIEEALSNTIDFYQEEVDKSLDNLTSLLEPIMIVFLGLIVAGLVAAVIMPLYQTVGGL
jgi:type II secretory pathway component PulF